LSPASTRPPSSTPAAGTAPPSCCSTPTSTSPCCAPPVWPLSLATTDQPRGTIGAALGYPGGGDLTVSPAAILAQRTAVGRNIYDAGLVRRDIYELQAVVRPGNSGGPLVAPDGTVIGVIFATSTSNGNIGYALTATEIIPDLGQARTADPVSTGACLAD
jgi:S1-C subfamily serine protease